MANTDRLSAREKFSYGFGDLASCLYWQTVSTYLALFYTDIFGITALAAGTMMGLSRSSDAFFDPVVGLLSDRTKSRWGKFRPFLLWGCVPLAIAGVLTFTVPNFGEHGKLIWAWVTFNALMIIYTTINIPYTAMLGVISPNPNERTALSSIKFVGAFSGGIIVSATLLPMAKVGGWLGATSVKQGWQMSFIVYGIVAIACFLLVFFNTRERVLPPKTQKTSLVKDLRDLVTNGPWLILLATTLTFIFFVALRGNSTAHYFKYYVGSQTLTLPAFFPKSMAGTQVWSWESLVSVFNTSTQFLSLIGAMLVPFVARRTGRKAAFIILFVIAIVSTAAFYVLKPDQIVLLFCINGLGSITGGPLSALLWAMYADTADYAEWKTGRRATGLVFSASIFAQKQGWGIAAGLSLILLNKVGFVANQAQTPKALQGLVNLMSLFPAILGVVSIILIILYPLNEKRMKEISAELDARRKNEEPEAAPVTT
ncbi:MAG TPA: MFS transporter [Opitutaceae bacterium]|nr:MFS transporter [Opitutaceae bacterium]